MLRRKAKHNKPRGAVRLDRQPKARLQLPFSKRWLLVFVLFGSLAAAAWQLKLNWQQTVVPLEQVSIDGEFRYLSPQQLQQTIASNLVGGYFTIDLHAIRDALLQLPWVQEATVRRQWPSGLRITVQEKTAVAYWNDDALLSSEGEVFRPQQVDRSMGLPVLAGPDGLHEKVWRFMARLQQDFAALDMQIDKLVLDQRRAWQIRLANGALIRLGRNDTEQRLHRFEQVFAMRNAPSLDNAEVIDLRYPNGFAVLAGNNMSQTTKTQVSNNRDGNTMTRESEV